LHGLLQPALDLGKSGFNWRGLARIGLHVEQVAFAIESVPLRARADPASPAGENDPV
jgi:hypothetical protein